MRTSFNNSFRRESQVLVCTFLKTNKVSKRSLYLCVLDKFYRRLHCENPQKHKLLCFCSCNLVPYSFLLLWNLFVHIWDGWRFSFFTEWIRYNRVINKSSCDWNKFSLIAEADIFLTRKHLKYACLYAKMHNMLNMLKYAKYAKMHLSPWGGCWFVVYIRRFIYKFLNVCPFD